MAKVATNIIIDEDYKLKAQAMLAEFGLDLSIAVNMLLRLMLRKKATPFEVRCEVPIADTFAVFLSVLFSGVFGKRTCFLRFQTHGNIR